jgi:transcriptional regulator with XRE-family HTH domain
MQTEAKNSSHEELSERLFDRQKNLVFRITSVLKEKGWTRKNLAEGMGIHESSLSRMLTSDSNLTLKTIAQAEIVLKVDLLLTPQEFEFHFISDKTYRRSLMARASKYDRKKSVREYAFSTIVPIKGLSVNIMQISNAVLKSMGEGAIRGEKNDRSLSVETNTLSEAIAA